MKVITIQSKEALMILKECGEYTVPNNAPISENLIKPYRFMMNHYGYSSRPIFLCPIGYYVNFGGANIEDSYIAELEIPDKYCKIQDYYCWSDFIYFTELPNEFKEFNGIKTVEQFGKYVLDMNKYGFNSGRETCYQVTTQFIHKNWVKQIVKMNETFNKLYIDTGGVNILQSIM